MDNENENLGRLYRQIILRDEYNLKKIDFVPNVIIDIGANVGVFTFYAHQVFPNAHIYAIEPDPDNYNELIKTYGARMENAALGEGVVYHKTGDGINSHEVYQTPCEAYPEELLLKSDVFVKTNIKSIPFYKIYEESGILGAKYFLKCDCEGAEISIFEDEKSFEVLKKMDYIVMEVHYYSLTSELNYQVKKLIAERLNELSKTHMVELKSNMLFARNKNGIS